MINGVGEISATSLHWHSQFLFFSCVQHLKSVWRLFRARKTKIANVYVFIEHIPWHISQCDPWKAHMKNIIIGNGINKLYNVYEKPRFLPLELSVSIKPILSNTTFPFNQSTFKPVCSLRKVNCNMFYTNIGVAYASRYVILLHIRSTDLNKYFKQLSQTFFLVTG